MAALSEKTMKALWYNSPENFEIREVPIPEVGDDDVLLKGESSELVIWRRLTDLLIIGSFSQTFCFPRAVAYLDSGKIRTKGMVTNVFKLEEYQEALDKMSSRGALKIAIRP
ncbi:hypothetical protein H0H93_001428 [Arthromyces matolae]|nr:hypothetical protein H0H93_001428 [Arthromyces matolae]